MKNIKNKAALNNLLMFVLVPLLILTIIGCGGDVNTELETAGTSGGSVTVAGVVTYTHYSLDQTSGIDYSSSNEEPIRGAVIELQDSSGTVLASGNTTETGGYSFSAPANSTVRIVVKAALGSPDSPHVTVVDNTNGGALYGIL